MARVGERAAVDTPASKDELDARRGRTRRNFLKMGVGLGAGAVAAAAFPLANMLFGDRPGGKRPSRRNEVDMRISIDPTQTDHIAGIIQNNPKLTEMVNNLFGTNEIRFIIDANAGHPNLLIYDPNSFASFQLVLQPVNQYPDGPAPSWDIVRRLETYDPSLWVSMDFGSGDGTRVGYHDIGIKELDYFPTDRVIGYTNIGTPDERRFDLWVENMPALLAMAPEDRRETMLRITEELMIARALG